MPEGEPLAADPRKPGRLRFVKGRRSRPGSASDRREIVTVRSGRQQKHAPRIRGQATGPHEEGPLHALPNRKRIVQRLNAAGVPTAVHYPAPLNRQPAYAEICRAGALPV